MTPAVLVLVCQLAVGPIPYAPPVMMQIYQAQYACPVRTQMADSDKKAMSPMDVASYFPSPSAWWPVFTMDHLRDPVYRALIEQGIKPGLILPQKTADLVTPKIILQVRRAIHDGAIPILIMPHNKPNSLNAKATFVSAMGFRPLAVLVKGGWSDNLPALLAGSYLIDYSDRPGDGELPLPARENLFRQSFYYYAAHTPAQGGGYSIVINPGSDMLAQGSQIRYPHLGVSWRYGDATYTSTLDGLDTSVQGRLIEFGTLLSVPVGTLFSYHLPDILDLAGSVISWTSLLIGGVLLLLLIIAIVLRWRRNR